MNSLGFDKVAGHFTHNGAPIALTPEQQAMMATLGWWQRIPFGPSCISPGKVDCAGKLPKYHLDRMNFKDKAVLGIGCCEGFPLFFVEAMGASRVVGIANDFGITPDISAAREFTRSALDSRVEFLSQSIYELTPENIGLFDVVLVFDALQHLRHPLAALERLAALSKGALVVCSPFVLSNDPTPWCALLPQFCGAEHERNLNAMNRAWFFSAFERIGFTPIEGTVHEFDYLSVLTARKEHPEINVCLSEAQLPTDEGMEDRTAVLVISCERYKQVWEPFFLLFQRYFPNCPYKVYFCSDRGTVNYPGVINLELGADYQWAGNAVRALQKIDAEQVLLFQEDFLLTASPNLSMLRKLARHALDVDAGCIRLAPIPGPTGIWPRTSALGTIGQFDEFRYSFQLTLWNKAILGSLLSEGDDPWTTEFVAARRSTFCTKPFLSVHSNQSPPVPYLPYAVDQGEWSDFALEFLQVEKIPMEGITKRIAKLERR